MRYHQSAADICLKTDENPALYILCRNGYNDFYRKGIDCSMNREIYRNASGFIVSYKSTDEPLLFNEMKSRLNAAALQKRGEASADFNVQNYEEVVAEIKREDFIFMAHIHPYMQKRDVEGKTTDYEIYLDMLRELLPMLEKPDMMVCQCKIDSAVQMEYSNKELTALLADELREHGFDVEPQKAGTVISLTVYDKQAYMGVSAMEDNVSDWTGGVLFYSKNEDIICRAEFKIEEACKTFGIGLAAGMRALDLGAAPGGWTHFLSRQGLLVDAVDPAELSDKVLQMDNVKHYKMTAQEFVKNREKASYDIMVNDMKMDTNESVDISCEMSSQLKEGGICLMTLKLPKTGAMKRIKIARKVLERDFSQVKIRKLYYNRSEVTVLAVK